jgi:hypothetical protein
VFVKDGLVPYLRPDFAARRLHQVNAVQLRIQPRGILAPVAAARLVALQGAGGNRSRQRIGVGAQALQIGRSSYRPGKFTDGVTGGLQGWVEAPGRRRRRTGSRFLSDGCLGSTRAEDEAFAERVGGEAVGSVEAVARTLADCEQARQGCAAIEVGGAAAVLVVGRRQRGPSPLPHRSLPRDWWCASTRLRLRRWRARSPRHEPGRGP